MSKTKNKSRNEVEYLRGVIRRLRAQVKYLKKRAHISNDIIIRDELEEYLEESNCTNCGKGHMEEFDFNFVIIKRCDICGYQEKEKKHPDNNRKGS